MGSISINTVLARYQSGFGYVAGNVAQIAANRLWATFANIPVYRQANISPGNSETIDLFEVNNYQFANVKFTNSKTNKEYEFGATRIWTGDYGKFLAPPLMVSFSRDKNVVRTAIDRSEIEVIEHFGLKPWSVKIQGILIDMEEHQYPQSAVQKVHEMFSAWGTYKVSGTIFQDLAIHQLFFDSDFEIGFIEGYADTVKFSVSAISTAPLEIQSKGY